MSELDLVQNFQYTSKQEFNDHTAQTDASFESISDSPGGHPREQSMALSSPEHDSLCSSSQQNDTVSSMLEQRAQPDQSPLSLAKQHHVPLWSNLEFFTTSMVKVDADTAIELLKSQKLTDQILYGHIRPIFISHLDRILKTHGLDPCCAPSNDLIQILLSERISSIVFGDNDSSGSIDNMCNRLIELSQLNLAAGLYHQAQHVFYQIMAQYPDQQQQIHLELCHCLVHLGLFHEATAVFDTYIDTHMDTFIMATCVALEYHQYGRARRLIRNSKWASTVQYEIIQMIYKASAMNLTENELSQMPSVRPFDGNLVLKFVVTLLQWKLGEVAQIALKTLLNQTQNDPISESDHITALKIETLTVCRNFHTGRELLPSVCDNTIRYELAADLEFDAGDSDFAFALYEQCCNSGTKRLKSLYRYANLAATRSLIEISIQAYSRLTTLYPLFSEAWLQLAILYESIGEQHRLQALYCMCECLRCNPYCRKIWIHIMDKIEPSSFKKSLVR